MEMNRLLKPLEMSGDSDCFGIVQVIPHVDGQADGVRDYALVLAWALRDGHRIPSVFIAGEVTGSRAWHEWEVQGIGQRAPGALLRLLHEYGRHETPLASVLHYVNYGYARRGCPHWLVEDLERWKKESPGSALITVFHELYAFGPPWRSSFWLSPVQRVLARRLAGLSDAAITSLPAYRERLVGWGMDPRRVGLYPVFSTVGELKHPRPLTERRRQLVVFGGSGLRRRLYTEGAVSLRTWLERLGLTEIADIGPPTGLKIEKLAGVPAREIGPADAAFISRTLAESYAGAVAYPLGSLGKSTVFAAYCAHGILPLVYAGGRRGVEEVGVGREYVLTDNPTVDCGNLQKVADEAHAWYQTHSVGVVAGRFAVTMGIGREPRVH